MKHKKQHFIPRSYLEAWCDPVTPHGHEPSAWIFPKDGGVAHRRAPKNVFHETELYTIRLPGGTRDLRLERGLAELESRFAAIRRTTLSKHKDIGLEKKVLISAFVAAMQGRTPKQRDHLQGFWSDLLEKMTAMQADMRSRPIAEQQAIGRASLRPSGSGESLDIEDVQKLAAAPLQHTLIPIIETQAPVLGAMDLAVFDAEPGTAFITSDAPCVWFDPEAHKRPFPYNSPGLAWPKIEVTLPASARQLLLFNRAGLDGYYVMKAPLVRELNRRTRGHAQESFVAVSDVSDPYWYQMAPDQNEEDRPAAE